MPKMFENLKQLNGSYGSSKVVEIWVIVIVGGILAAEIFPVVYSYFYQNLSFDVSLFSLGFFF